MLTSLTKLRGSLALERKSVPANRWRWSHLAYARRARAGTAGGPGEPAQSFSWYAPNVLHDQQRDLIKGNVSTIPAGQMHFSTRGWLHVEPTAIAGGSEK